MLVIAEKQGSILVHPHLIELVWGDRSLGLRSVGTVIEVTGTSEHVNKSIVNRVAKNIARVMMVLVEVISDLWCLRICPIDRSKDCLDRTDWVRLKSRIPNEFVKQNSKSLGIGMNFSVENLLTLGS